MLIQPERVASVPEAWEREDPTMFSPVEELQPQAPWSSVLYGQ